MSAGERPPASVTEAVRSIRPSLNPGEQAVCDVLLADPAAVIEATAADVARLAGVSTATVVRTAQRLGFRGFPHLRVLLARDLGTSGPVAADGDGSVRGHFRAVGAAVTAMASLLDDEQVAQAVELLAGARRILVVGGGVSAPVALDLAMRLVSVGRPADAPADSLDQRIRAGLLGPEDVCVAVSGTGATGSTLAAARAARSAGASVVALTSFARSPLGEVATVELLTTAGSDQGGLQEELASTFRIPQLILGSALVAAVAARLPEETAAARRAVLEVVATELQEPPPGG